MPERSDPTSNAEIVHNALAPKGSGGASPSASLPLLNDAPASPASRRPRIRPGGAPNATRAVLRRPARIAAVKAVAVLVLTLATGGGFSASDRAALNLAIGGTRDAPPDLFDLIIQHRREYLSGVRETIALAPAADVSREARALSQAIVNRTHFPDVIHRLGMIVGEVLALESPRLATAAEKRSFEDASAGPYRIPGISSASAAGNPAPVAASVGKAAAELREKGAGPDAAASRIVSDETNLLWAIWVGAGGDARPAKKFEEKNGPYIVAGAPR